MKTIKIEIEAEYDEKRVRNSSMQILAGFKRHLKQDYSEEICPFLKVKKVKVK